LNHSPVENLFLLRTQILEFSKNTQFSAENILIEAVSKRQPLDKIESLLVGGHRIFAENKVQEALVHWQDFKSQYPDVKLHLIGNLQSNKVRDAVKLFTVIETVDSEKLAKLIAVEAEKNNKKQQIMLQVNIGDEPQKSGVNLDDLVELLGCVRQYESLELIGLMCIPPVNNPPAPYFAKMLELKQQYELSCLSMGMSGDYQTAIRFGATHIRLGTAIFGDRL
jgi:PLP dependent protein